MAQPTQWILHLGLGSFHRAHQALYLQWLHEQGDHDWALAGGNLRPDMAELINALDAQHGAYTLETVTPQGERAYQRIESIKKIIRWDKDHSGLITMAADPATKIISFTVTEAGYYLDTQDRLDLSYPDLASDVAGTTCCTIYGALQKLLDARKEADAGPVTLLNCDNLRSNGDRFIEGFKQFLALSGNGDLIHWVLNNTSAPNSMVDRITPRPSVEVVERVKTATGIEDNAALMSESFIQWVIEDHFVAGRPQWEKVGAELVDDVMPFEEAKIRILNATHSCIAWAGTLAGYSFIHEGTLDPEIRQFGFDYVTQDVIPVLTPCPLDLVTYRDVVLERFGNDNVLDTNGRVAMDGFSKIPGFILPTIRDNLQRGESFDAAAMLPAFFLAFLIVQQRGDLPYPYEDQIMPTESAQRIVSAADPVAAFCSERLLFNDLAGHPTLEESLRKAYQHVKAFQEKIGIFAL